MGIILGALAGAGRAAGEIADANTKLWGQQELEAQRADIAAKRDAALAAMQEQSSIRAEGRGLVIRAQERKDVFNESVANAPALRQVKTDDAKAAKMVELDPEIQALMRKAENEKLTSAEQAKLDFYTQNKKEILGKKRDEARAGDIDHGAGLRSVQIEAAKLTLEEKKTVNAMMKEYETTQDPARKTAIRDALINRGILKPSGSGEFDTEKVTTEKMNPDGTTSKTEHTQRRNPGGAAPKPTPGKNGWDSDSGQVYKDGKVIGTAKSLAEARAMANRNSSGQVGG